MKTSVSIFFTLILLMLFHSCSSIKYTRRDGHTNYKTEKTFEYNYQTVWNATYNVIAANADIEIAEKNSGIIKTSWAYTQSDIDVAQYKVDSETRYKPLRLRYRYLVTLHRVTGGIKVKINSEQEYERLNENDFETPSNDWVVTDTSTSRENTLLKAIATECLKQ